MAVSQPQPTIESKSLCVFLFLVLAASGPGPEMARTKIIKSKQTLIKNRQKKQRFWHCGWLGLAGCQSARIFSVVCFCLIWVLICCLFVFLGSGSLGWLACLAGWPWPGPGPGPAWLAGCPGWLAGWPDCLAALAGSIIIFYIICYVIRY